MDEQSTNTSNEGTLSAYRAKPEDYRLLIEREWADLHHSRIQEWSALGVVLAVHIGLIQLGKLAGEQQIATLPLSFALIAAGIVFALVGILVTCRHRQLMVVKLQWIYAAEKKLGLVKSDDNPDGIVPESAKIPRQARWDNLAWPRRFSTSWLIAVIYILLALFDVGAGIWLL